MEGNLVYYDETTKCHSRFYYDNIVKDKYRDRLCYVVYVDINGLKETNDKYGHHYGTKLIKQVASNLLSVKGAKDICRIGVTNLSCLAMKILISTKWIKSQIYLMVLI